MCPLPPPAPPAPFIYQAIRINETTIKLLFTPGGKPYSHYHLSYGYLGQPESFGAIIDNPDSGEVTVAGLIANASYQFKLLPVNECATGPWSNTFPVTLLPPRPPRVPAVIEQALERQEVSPPAPAVTSSELTPEPARPVRLAATLLLLALLFLFLPARLGMVYARDSKRPLAGAQVFLEKEGRVYAQRVSNRLGIYRGFKVREGTYLIRTIYPHYQFPYSLNHERLNLIANYYDQEIKVPSWYQPFIAPLLPLIPSSLSPEGSEQERHWYYYLWYGLVRLERALGYLQPLAFFLCLYFLIFAFHWLYALIMALYLLGIAKRLVVRPLPPPNLPPSNGSLR